MNIAIKQTNHPYLANNQSFRVHRRTFSPDWLSANANEDGLTLRVDLGETGSLVVDIDNVFELGNLKAAIETAIKNLNAKES